MKSGSGLPSIANRIMARRMQSGVANLRKRERKFTTTFRVRVRAWAKGGKLREAIGVCACDESGLLMKLLVGNEFLMLQVLWKRSLLNYWTTSFTTQSFQS